MPDKMPKHTPGDWRYRYSDGSGGYEDGDGGTILSDNDIHVVRGGCDSWGVELGVVGRTPEEADANGELLAKAPTMQARIEQLENLVRQYHKDLTWLMSMGDDMYYIPHLKHWQPTIEQINAVLANKDK